VDTAGSNVIRVWDVMQDKMVTTVASEMYHGKILYGVHERQNGHPEPPPIFQ
jgi:hypothetical protein